MAVEKADAHQRDSKVFGALHVVACEDAEAPGILLHRLVDREFRAVVGDLQAAVAAPVNLLEPARVAPCILERLLRGVERLEKAGIGRGDPSLRGGQHRLDRGVIRRLPGDRIEHREGTLGCFVPGPGEVFRDSKQAGQQFVDRRGGRAWHEWIRIGA